MPEPLADEPGTPFHLSRWPFLEPPWPPPDEPD